MIVTASPPVSAVSRFAGMQVGLRTVAMNCYVTDYTVFTLLFQLLLRCFSCSSVVVIFRFCHNENVRAYTKHKPKGAKRQEEILKKSNKIPKIVIIDKKITVDLCKITFRISLYFGKTVL